jgi:hypothetical protein
MSFQFNSDREKIRAINPSLIGENELTIRSGVGSNEKEIIRAQLDSNTSLYFYSLDSGSIYNFYYVILQGVKYNFGGGEDAFGSLVIPSGTTVPLLVTSASISTGSVLFYL